MRFWVPALLVLTACSNPGTFVHVEYSGELDAAADHLDVALTLGTENVTVRIGSSGSLTLPTDGTFEFRTGAGALEVLAIARDASEIEVGRGSASTVVVRGKTITLPIVFVAAHGGGDGGTDDLDDSDGGTDAAVEDMTVPVDMTIIGPHLSIAREIDGLAVWNGPECTGSGVPGQYTNFTVTNDGNVATSTPWSLTRSSPTYIGFAGSNQNAGGCGYPSLMSLGPGESCKIYVYCIDPGDEGSHTTTVTLATGSGADLHSVTATLYTTTDIP